MWLVEIQCLGYLIKQIQLKKPLLHYSDSNNYYTYVYIYD